MSTVNHSYPQPPTYLPLEMAPHTTIHSLPPETLLLILEMAAYDSSGAELETIMQRYNFLYIASLVCKSWSVQANLLFGAEVRVWDDASALRLLESAKERRDYVPSLSIWGSGFGHMYKERGVGFARLFGQCFESVKEVRCLALMSIASIDPAVLSSPCLSNLTSLQLSNTAILTGDIHLHLLKTLHLEDSFSLFGRPYSSFTLPSLTSLIFIHRDPTPPNPTQTNDLLLFFLSVFPQLSSLSVFHQSCPLSNFLPAFNSCTKLSNLRLVCSGEELVAIMSTFPTFVNNIELGPWYDCEASHSEALATTKKFVTEIGSVSQCRSLSMLNRIRFGCGNLILKIPGGAKLVNELEEKGVKVSLVLPFILEHEESDRIWRD